MPFELRLSVSIILKVHFFNWSFFGWLPVELSQQLVISILNIFLIFSCILSLQGFTYIWFIEIKFSLDDLLEPITILLVASDKLLLLSGHFLFLLGRWFLSAFDLWAVLDVFLAANSIKIVLKLHGHIFVLCLRATIISVGFEGEREIPRSLTRSAHAWKTVIYIILTKKEIACLMACLGLTN